MELFDLAFIKANAKAILALLCDKLHISPKVLFLTTSLFWPDKHDID